jgi:hypothetical protein
VATSRGKKKQKEKQKEKRKGKKRGVQSNCFFDKRTASRMRSEKFMTNPPQNPPKPFFPKEVFDRSVATRQLNSNPFPRAPTHVQVPCVAIPMMRVLLLLAAGALLPLLASGWFLVGSVPKQKTEYWGARGREGGRGVGLWPDAGNTSYLHQTAISGASSA